MRTRPFLQKVERSTQLDVDAHVTAVVSPDDREVAAGCDDNANTFAAFSFHREIVSLSFKIILRVMSMTNERLGQHEFSGLF